MSIEKDDAILYDITPFTVVDWPGKLAAIAWFAGCNMRCLYCYNADIVFAEEGRYTPEDLYALLAERKGLLDGVVLSGGEATRYDLLPICKKIKRMGFGIKLDTNGLRPDRLRALIESNLLDYIALDFKADYQKFGFITGSSRYGRFVESLELLLEKSVAFEVRTTVHADLLDKEDLGRMAQFLKSKGYDKPYYLQPFIETPHNLGHLKASTRPSKPQPVTDLLPIVWR